MVLFCAAQVLLEHGIVTGWRDAKAKRAYPSSRQSFISSCSIPEARDLMIWSFSPKAPHLNTTTMGIKFQGEFWREHEHLNHSDLWLICMHRTGGVSPLSKDACQPEPASRPAHLVPQFHHQGEWTQIAVFPRLCVSSFRATKVAWCIKRMIIYVEMFGTYSYAHPGQRKDDAGVTGTCAAGTLAGYGWS